MRVTILTNPFTVRNPSTWRNLGQTSDLFGLAKGDRAIHATILTNPCYTFDKSIYQPRLCEGQLVTDMGRL